MNFSTIGTTVAYLHSFGIYGPLVAFVLFFIQAIAPIIPFVIIAGAAGMIFGTTAGFLLAWFGALTGACFLFWITRVFGGDFLVHRIQDKYEFDLNNVDQKHVFWTLLMARIFPVVPTVIINVGSALGGVRFDTFFFSSAVGKLPWALIYVYLGNYLIQSQNIINTLLFIAASLIIAAIGIYYYRDSIPFRKKK